MFAKITAIIVMAAVAAVAAAATGPAPPSGNHNGTATLARRGGRFCGRMTYYEPAGAPGSCGAEHSAAEMVVALAEVHYGPLCGRAVRVTHGATGRSVAAAVADTCPVCRSETQDAAPVADLTRGLFDALGGGDGVLHGCVELL